MGATSSYSTTLYGAEVGTAALDAGALAINGYSVGASAADGVSYTGSDSSAIAVASAINAISGSSGVTATASSTNTTITLAGTAATAFTAVAAGDVKINGVSIGALAATTTVTLRGAAVATAINKITGDTGVTAVATAGVVALTSTSGKLVIDTGTTGTSALTGLASTVVANSTLTTYGGTTVTGHETALVAADVLINGVDIGAIAAAGTAIERGGQVSAAINAISSQTGVTAGFDTSSGKVFLSAADGRNITVKTTANGAAATTGLSSGGATTDTTRSVITLTSASADGITISDIGGSSATASGLTVGYTATTETAGAGVSSLDLTTATGAQDALTTLDSAINTITDSRASMGAYQNRLTASIANLETTSMNLSASRSRILDTDYAKETTNLAKAQIISQAATAMLAQANQSGQSVLALLK